MLVLALDSSSAVAVSLVDDGTVLAARRVDEQRRHAELLAPMIREVLGQAGVDRRALEAVVVGTGPAPFTGLRAGLVTARTLAWSLGVPVLGVCSLEAYAVQAYRTGAARPDQAVLVVTDARRREVYTARYRMLGDSDVTAVTPPAVAHPVDLAGSADVVVGPGAALYPEHLAGAPDGPTALDPAVLAVLAVARRAGGVEQPTEPLYLRRPDVTPSAGRKRATG